jgi:hypothetical protein
LYIHPERLTESAQFRRIICLICPHVTADNSAMQRFGFGFRQQP